MSIESDIKKQYAKFFEKTDWRRFKLIAEYYLRKAVDLKKKEIKSDKANRLLIRNIQKRLFIGIGCELLIKAYFLLNGYCINKPKRDYISSTRPPYLLSAIKKENFHQDNSLTFNKLLEQLPKTSPFSACSSESKNQIMKGFKIAKVFRNKEGHVTTLWHDFDPSNYSDIETALMQFYDIALSEKLNIQFSFELNEKSIFNLTSP